MIFINHQNIEIRNQHWCKWWWSIFSPYKKSQHIPIECSSVKHTYIMCGLSCSGFAESKKMNNLRNFKWIIKVAMYIVQKSTVVYDYRIMARLLAYIQHFCICHQRLDIFLKTYSWLIFFLTRHLSDQRFLQLIV